MKIVYLIAGTYRPAGMERVLANKTSWLASHGHEIVIVTTDQRGQEPAFAFDPSIRHIDLGIDYETNNGGSFIDKLIHYPFKQMRHRARLAKVLKAEKADVTVSMFCNDASFVPRIKDGSRKVLEIHFSRFKRLQYGRKGLWALADKWRAANDVRVASRFDKFVVLTDEDRGYWGDMRNISVIPNARTFKLEKPAALDSKVVIAVGRYSYQKNFADLIKAWSMIDSFVRDGWTLKIIGDGEERPVLEKAAAEYGVADSVILGPSSEIRKEYAGASFLAMSSRYEGLPMVLLEAQAAGLPIVSYKCKCGPLDVVSDGVDGILVEENDTAGLAAGMSRLMADEGLRKSMGSNAFAASGRFDEEAVMARWIDLFESL